MINVLLVEDTKMGRDCIAGYLRGSDRYRLAAAITNAALAETTCRHAPINLILMDYRTENDEDGIAAAAVIKRKMPHIKIIIITSMASIDLIDRAREAGADSFWYKETSDEELLAFPYVNGGLFGDKSMVIPKLDAEIVDLILEKASADFDWSVISPTIFGAVFESTLNPETRRSGGMHYTSIENIHKVIDPLFLDDLRAELDEIKSIPVDKTRDKRLKEFQSKLAGLTFLEIKTCYLIQRYTA